MAQYYKQDPHRTRRITVPRIPMPGISVKPGKARKSNYLSQLSVDTAHHVITDIKAYHADGKDNQQLRDIVKRLQRRLWQQGLVFENRVADTGTVAGRTTPFWNRETLKAPSSPWHI